MPTPFRWMRAAVALCMTPLMLVGCALSRYEPQITESHKDISQRAEQANQLLRNYPGPTPSVVNSQTPLTRPGMGYRRPKALEAWLESLERRRVVNRK